MKREEDPMHQPIGSVLPPRELFGLKQTVAAVDFDRDLVTFTMTDGYQVTVFSYSPLKFPRRPDGVTYDWRWRYPDNPPLASEIYPGDVLPPNSANPYSEPDDYQIVASVRGFVKSRFKFVNVRTKESHAWPNSYVFQLDEPCRFPREERSAGAPQGDARKQATGAPAWFGPYLNNTTGTFWLFTYHPFGRGRWPSDIRLYDPTAPPLLDSKGQPLTAADGDKACRKARWPEQYWDEDLLPMVPDLPVGRVRQRRGPNRRTTEPKFTFN